MKLSENQDLVQKLKQILKDYPDLDYNERGSARMDNMLMVNTVSNNARCDISMAADIARRLSESTGDQYKVQQRSGSGRLSFENSKEFGLFQFMPNKNVRITYPDSKGAKLEVDIIEGVEMSLNLNDADMWYFAEGDELEIHFNIYAKPKYHKLLRSHVTRVTRDYTECLEGNHSANNDSKKTVDENLGFSK